MMTWPTSNLFGGVKYVVDRLLRVIINIIAKSGFVCNANVAHFMAFGTRVMSIMLASPCLSHWWEKVGPSEAENDFSIMHGVVLRGKLVGYGYVG